jgi:hypothetical protein
MNLPLCLWLWRRATFNGDQVDLMVHEPYLPFRADAARHALVAAVQRIMTVVLLHSAYRVRVSIPGWKSLLKPYALGRHLTFTWLPIPSILPDVEDEELEANEIRKRYDVTSGAIVGHFGTYTSLIAESLTHVLPPLMESECEPTVLLIGAGSEQLRERICRCCPHLASRVRATGVLRAQELTRHLAACDMVIQPYPDGVSSRRTTVMAALALGVPVVTTKGPLTERLWNEVQAVALTNVTDYAGMIRHAERLLADGKERKRLGAAGRALYLERFNVRHTIAALRDAAVRSVIDTQYEESPAAVGLG